MDSVESTISLFSPKLSATFIPSESKLVLNDRLRFVNLTNPLLFSNKNLLIFSYINPEKDLNN